MANSVAIVTGSGGGIGWEISSRLIRDGFSVFGIDSHEESDDMEVPGYTHTALNLTELSEAADIIHQLPLGTERNVLVNCAGIREICSISELSLALWSEVITVNVTAPFVLSREFGLRLRANKRPGSIINIASVAGLLGEPQRTAYVTSKHAIIGLTKELAIEFGMEGITANSVAPGVIRTPLTEQYYSDEHVLGKIRGGQFVPRDGSPSDVASAVSFLVSPEASFINGATLCVDGGWTAGKQL